jgi:hypothetical protein
MSTAPDIHQPFSNLQLELLKLYADNISEADLKAIQRLIARYFAEKGMDIADEEWEKKSYDSDVLLKERMRTPYKKGSPA